MKRESIDTTGQIIRLRISVLTGLVEQKTIPIVNSWVLFLHMSYGFWKRNKNNEITEYKIPGTLQLSLD